MTRKLLVAAATGVLGLVLAGCGAGPDALTARTLPSVPGVSADAEGVAVRNAVVVFSPDGYAAGEQVPIELSVINDGNQPVRLTGATSAAGSVTLAGVTRVGQPAGGEPPGGTGGQADLTVAPEALVHVTLRVAGLAEPLNGTGTLPLELTFDNGAEFSLDLPMATPDEPIPREPVVSEPEH